jgi:class 3 adenylate cyclase/pimeloyl-ACP methyl ester carboxylesterase
VAYNVATMEPRIQYARTSDGMNIAWYAIGDGPPLVVMSAGLHQSIEFDWKVSNFRTAAEVSSRTFTYVRYDPRGSGLSDRDVEEFSLEAMVRDLEAVTSTLNFEQFRLFAPGHLGMAGAAFAAHHSDRLSHLVLWASAVQGNRFSAGPLRPLRDLVESDWRLASETLIRTVDHWDNPDLAREHAEVMRASVEPATYLHFFEATDRWDLSALLPAITCPTLIIHPASNPYYPVAEARQLAAGITNSRLALVEGRSVLMPGMEVLRIAGQFFLGLERPGPADERRTLPSGTTVILFADIVDSTELTERLGDAAFRAKARDLDTALRGIIRDSDGTPVEGKLLGDGVLATFASAKQAIEAALRCGEAGDGAGLPLHLGLHAGDVIREEGNVFGGAVNIAARIADASAPGELLVSQTVRDLARTSAAVAFDDRGLRKLKGVEGRQRLFAVRPVQRT